ncbi:hypothetical protein JW824_02870 [bacterium]|nr:hypothetical protein [bacterium]
MFKKCITLITLTAFIIFTLSCGSTKYLGLDSVSEFEEQKINITRVVKTTGEEIQFTNASDTITENDIIGEAKGIVKEIDREDILATELIYGGTTFTHHITMKDGNQYNLRSYQELDEQTVFVKLDEEIMIPLSEIKEIEFEKRNRGKGGSMGYLVGFLTTGTLTGIIFGAYNPAAGIGNIILASLGIGVLYGLPFIFIGRLIGVQDKYILTESVDVTLEKIEIEEEVEIEERIDTEGRVINTISDRLGEIIDLQERNSYNLFSSIQGFQSAVLFKLPDGRYVFEITTLNETTGEETIEQVIQTESQIEQIRDYIEQFE